MRPSRISSARVKRSGLETPIEALARQEYDAIPDKTSTGIPTCFHFSRLRDTAKLYLWPLLITAAGETLEITYEREFEEADDFSDGPDHPAEWENAAVYGLAVMLSDNHGKSGPTDKAGYFLQQALAADREGSVYFCSEGYE